MIVEAGNVVAVCARCSSRDLEVGQAPRCLKCGHPVFTFGVVESRHGASTIELVLPYPPSVNRYYRNVGRRTLISRDGRNYRKRVCALLEDRFRQPLAVPLEVELHLYPPDRRRRDWDNFQKAVWDSLQHAGLFLDDSQIGKATVEKHEPDGSARAVVLVTRRPTV